MGLNQQLTPKLRTFHSLLSGTKTIVSPDGCMERYSTFFVLKVNQCLYIKPNTEKCMQNCRTGSGKEKVAVRRGFLTLYKIWGLIAVRSSSLPFTSIRNNLYSHGLPICWIFLAKSTA
jgi:hypothetical protein